MLHGLLGCPVRSVGAARRPHAPIATKPIETTIVFTDKFTYSHPNEATQHRELHNLLQKKPKVKHNAYIPSTHLLQLIHTCFDQNFANPQGLIAATPKTSRLPTHTRTASSFNRNLHHALILRKVT